MDEVLGFDDDVPLSDDDAGADSGDELEEDVMAAQDEDDDEDGGQGFKAALKKSAKKGKWQGAEDGRGEAPSAARDAASSGTLGWKGQDFYGGDDAGGDSSDGGTDEELNFQEAKRLEELRAQRLGGLAVSDPMAVLLGGDAEEEKISEAAGAEAAEEQVEDGAAALAPKGAASQFESIFESTAEKATVQRDLSQLPESKRKSLMKKEAPELMPLLEDYQTKLERLREMMPLLSPHALAKLPKSGAAYLEAKAALLLNTLANLAFYVLLKAEGGSVRTHPVVSQLVWLKELHEKVAPLDKRLKPKLKKALKAAKQAAAAEKAGRAAPSKDLAARTDEADRRGSEAAAPEAPRKLGLREKLERLRAVEAATKTKGPQAAKAAARAAAAAAEEQALDAEPDTVDLLRLPSRRRQGGPRGAPADLDEHDPTLGAWLPASTISEQLQSVRQYVGAGKAKSASADLDVEAKPRRARERMQEDPAVAAATSGRQRPPGVAQGGDLGDDDNDGDDDGAGGGGLIKQALEKAKKKKEKKSDQEVAREHARLLRQHWPEEEVDGRRKTSKRILDNRGLLRQRKSKAGNARVSNRKKYEDKLKRRRGAVQEIREGAGDGATYAGESTGVRTHLKKSMKLG